MITITGATGKTGSIVSTALLEHGEQVRVIGRSTERLKTLQSKGAQTAIGDQGDAVFLSKALEGADALYLLIPPKYDAPDFRRYYNDLGDAAIKAIRKSGVGKVVFLSSLGADKPAGTGPVVGLYDVEQKLRTLTDVDIVFLRPGYFMENTLGTIELIKEKGINGSPMPPDIPFTLTAASDIGLKAMELLLIRDFSAHSTIEIAGDRLTFTEITSIIGKAVGKPELPYIQLSDAEAEAAFIAMGLSTSVARSYIELMHGIADGLVATIFIAPETLNAPTRFTTFVEEVFKPVFMEVEHHTMA